MTDQFSSVQAVGETFLQHYLKRGYEQIPGSSLLVDSLPMTFVMSAGMVQFETLAGRARAGEHFALIQTCFRHFDMDRVGESAYHLSLFQMPGAFEFGPINRDRVIGDIWNLLTEGYRLPAEALAVTYFRGGDMEGQFVPADEATAAAWQKAGVSSDRLFALPAECNFWRQSAHMVGIVNSRKCGPNTEVFYDRGRQYACGADCRPGCACGRYVEFQNTLFIEHYFDDEGHLSPLAEPFTEAVIGQERVAMLLQGADSVYAIETVLPLIEQIRCFSEAGLLQPVEITHFERILADHIRALLFLVQDGAPAPGRGGRARLMRTLVREFLTASEMMGITDPGFLRSLLFVAGKLYPERSSALLLVARYIQQEAFRFEDTLAKGLSNFDRTLLGEKMIDGQTLLKYEKQQGIPFALLQYRLRQKGLPFNVNLYFSAKKQFNLTKTDVHYDRGIKNHESL